MIFRINCILNLFVLHLKVILHGRTKLELQNLTLSRKHFKNYGKRPDMSDISRRSDDYPEFFDDFEWLVYGITMKLPDKHQQIPRPDEQNGDHPDE